MKFIETLGGYVNADRLIDLSIEVEASGAVMKAAVDYAGKVRHVTLQMFAFKDYDNLRDCLYAAHKQLQALVRDLSGGEA